MHVGELRSCLPDVPLELVQSIPPELRRHLERPNIARWAAAFAVLLSLPAIATGLQIDDLFHRSTLEGTPPYGTFAKSPLQLFTFFDGNAERTNAMIREGVFAWWTGPNIRLAFMRPLSAATHWFDHTLFPGAPWLMHIHSYLWAAVAVLLVAALYRRWLPAAWTAGLATVMFAINDAHAAPYTWIAQRNATIALVFGVGALLLHQRRKVLPGAVCFALALAAGEPGLATLTLVAAHELFLEDDALRARVLRVAAYLPVLAAWAWAYRHFGYGTRGSALYIDPGMDPLRFVALFFERFPLLMAGSVVSSIPDYAFFLPRGPYYAVVALAWIITLLVAWWVAPALRSRRTARFFAAVMVLSVLPACATIPSGRLLMFSTVGSMGLFAEAIAHRASGASRFMLGLRLYASPVLLVVGNFQTPIAGSVVERFAASMPMDAALTEQELILVTAFDATGVGYVSMARKLAGGPVPRHIHVMAVGDQNLMITRVDERTLLVRPERGFLSDQFSRLFRGDPFEVGTRVRWVHAWIEVVELTNDLRPAVVRFTFDEPLESTRYRWMYFHGRALQPFALPVVGANVTVAPGVLF
jgi:hypothetical protein